MEPNEGFIDPRPFHFLPLYLLLSLVFCPMGDEYRDMLQIPLPSGLEQVIKEDKYRRGDRQCVYKPAACIPSQLLLTDTHFKCLVALEKRKIWEFTFAVRIQSLLGLDR